jgi:hypothetical protein
MHVRTLPAFSVILLNQRSQTYKTRILRYHILGNMEFAHAPNSELK